MKMSPKTLPQTCLRVSPLVLGGAAMGSDITGEQLDALLDAYHAAGGNWLDTAHCYAAWTPAGAGCSERAIGEYLRRRGNRSEWVLATKGGHPAMNGYDRPGVCLSPQCIARDLDESLDRLGVEVVDLYWLHRDDERLGVDEIVDMLDAHISAGRLRYVGVSNWTLERLAAANAYAEQNGRAGFVATQPRWHLACVAGELPDGMRFLDLASRRWCREQNLTMVPYTATAGGAFATGKMDKLIDTPETHARIERARRLAEKLHCTPNQVALAWLMCQPQPVFPIIGTGNIAHLKDAIGATQIALSPEQVAWLETG
jgi:aryl-alcohol dehydrogenase-like predicted oxidoreductase